MQFARDAHVAEGWMIAQEPYLKNENLGVSRLNLHHMKLSEGLTEKVGSWVQLAQFYTYIQIYD